MTRRLLNLVAMVLLTTVTMVSAARVVCLLPCFNPQTAEAYAHCGHAAAEEVERISAQPHGCGDCEQVGLENADRLSSRHTIIGPDGITTVTSLSQQVVVPPVGITAGAPASPRGLSPGRAPVPLRI